MCPHSLLLKKKIFLCWQTKFHPFGRFHLSSPNMLRNPLRKKLAWDSYLVTPACSCCSATLNSRPAFFVCTFDACLPYLLPFQSSRVGMLTGASSGDTRETESVIKKPKRTKRPNHFCMELPTYCFRISPTPIWAAKNTSLFDSEGICAPRGHNHAPLQWHQNRKMAIHN